MTRSARLKARASEGYDKRFALLKVTPRLHHDDVSEMRDLVDDHIGATHASRCVLLLSPPSAPFTLFGLPLDAPKKAHELFGQLASQRMEVTINDVVYQCGSFVVGPRGRDRLLLVLDTRGVEVLDVALGLAEVLHAAGLVAHEDVDAVVPWCHRDGGKPGVFVSCPTQSTYDALLAKGYIIVDSLVRRVVVPAAPSVKPAAPARDPAPSVKATYSAAASGLTAAKVAEMLAPVQAAIGSLAASLAAVQESLKALTAASSSTGARLDSLTRSISLSNEGVASLKVAVARLERGAGTPQQPVPSAGTQVAPSVGHKEPRRGFFSPSARDTLQVADPPLKAAASPLVAVPKSVLVPPSAPQSDTGHTGAATGAGPLPRDEVTAVVAAAAAAGPAPTQSRFFARKSHTVVGASKRDLSAESEDADLKAHRSTTERLGSAFAYMQRTDVESDGRRLHASLVAPVTFFVDGGRILLDTGGSSILARFCKGWAETFESESGATMVVVHDTLQQADARLLVFRDSQWEVVNEGAPFFTIYRPSRMEITGPDDPLFIAFHVRNDTARARVVSLLPSQHTQ
jgi:hypothetical protein